MAWLSDLAGKAEEMLNNIDKTTAAVLKKDDGSHGRTHFLSRDDDSCSVEVRSLPPSDTDQAIANEFIRDAGDSVNMPVAKIIPILNGQVPENPTPEFKDHRIVTERNILPTFQVQNEVNVNEHPKFLTKKMKCCLNPSVKIVLVSLTNNHVSYRMFTCKHPVTDMIIRQAHEHNLHAGIQTTLHFLRQKFWILNVLHETEKVSSKESTPRAQSTSKRHFALFIMIARSFQRRCTEKTAKKRIQKVHTDLQDLGRCTRIRETFEARKQNAKEKEKLKHLDDKPKTKQFE
ncbi:unnamed protein product [Trichogramma brassicae]|uniref:Integrase zinc-binding domain-containing protein n=1 Tax=Trichogramma brassicae TaxID=86971 RepID=A0A6H5HYG5_9HYME|nr:unnamed protein product [Trichogramma brassicae]